MKWPRTAHALPFVLGASAALMAGGQTLDQFAETYLSAFFVYGAGIFLFGPMFLAMNLLQLTVALAAAVALVFAARSSAATGRQRALAWAAVLVTLGAGLVVVGIPAVAFSPLWNYIPSLPLWLLVSGWELWLTAAVLAVVALATRRREAPTTPASVDLWFAVGAAAGTTAMGLVVPIGLTSAVAATDVVAGFWTFVLMSARWLPALPALLAVVLAPWVRTAVGRLRLAVALFLIMAGSAPTYVVLFAWPTALAAAIAAILALIAAATCAREARMEPSDWQTAR